MGAIRVKLGLIPGMGNQMTPEIKDRVVGHQQNCLDVEPTDAGFEVLFSRIRAEPGRNGPLAICHFGRRQLAVAIGNGMAPQLIRRLPIGIEVVTDQFFKHCPPTAVELERAIEAVENEVMRLHADVPPGCSLALAGEASERLLEVSEGRRREDVEGIFQRLAAVSLGTPSAGIGLPSDNAFAASVLLLREFMHHLGFEAVLPCAPEISPAAHAGDGLTARAY